MRPQLFLGLTQQSSAIRVEENYQTTGKILTNYNSDTIESYEPPMMRSHNTEESAGQTLLRLPSTHDKNSKADNHFKNAKLLEVHKALIDLYLDVKVRSNDEIVGLNDDQLEKEEGRLMEIDSLALIEYIKTSIEILLNLKMETSNQSMQMTIK